MRSFRGDHVDSLEVFEPAAGHEPAAPTVSLRLLGPLEVVAGTTEVPLPQRKLRQLLATLLIRPNATVSSDSLIRDLWGDRPPATAVSALRVYVSQLRKFLARHGLDSWCVLRTRTPGYQLAVDDGVLDTVRFERLCRLGRERADAGDLEAASRLYREALALRRGPTLEDLRDGPARAGAALQYDEAWMTALRRRIDVDLTLGGHHELVGELRRLTAEDHLNEGLCARLVLALHRSGRSGEALDVYRRARAQLIKELGIEPGVELRTAHRTVLSDGALAPAVSATA
ncbi:AfsR/SARP family transcriptional regulator [Actinacidiphila paucisporea]|uniref:DNA-binding transcriptional activator of the SARP family n=1 Tax=Actinacidiphila paucisporea TaxID=310782 RepID=A0A1M7N8X9_9ACTN|nr:AfsR/SARP family transcriptional regulator [Actinacidiphila paucisporea]SHN00041.1 DNA-binding transcriptional activator of the SARP family [Actinacidiphila paucisporea]